MNCTTSWLLVGKTPALDAVFIFTVGFECSINDIGSQFSFVIAESTEFMAKRVSTMENLTTGTSLSGLAPLFMEQPDEDGAQFPIRILASTMRRSAETATFDGLQSHVEQMSALNPLDKGDFAGMELEELQVENPTWYENLQQEPFHTRYVPVRGLELHVEISDRIHFLLIY
jgi:Histidine phosphatase superfamily (branch 1)